MKVCLVVLRTLWFPLQQFLNPVFQLTKSFRNAHSLLEFSPSLGGPETCTEEVSFLKVRDTGL